MSTLKHSTGLVKMHRCPEYLVLSAEKEAAEETIQAWHKNKAGYLLSDEIRERLDQHIQPLTLTK